MRDAAPTDPPTPRRRKRDRIRSIDERFLDRMGRIGHATRGLVFLLIGVLVVTVLLGNAPENATQTGILRELAERPGGIAIVLLVGTGLACYALLRLQHAISNDHVEEGLELLAKRIGLLGQTVGYAGLSTYALGVAIGLATDGGGTERATAFALSLPYGQWLVGLVGLAVVGTGLGLAVIGGRKDFRGFLRPDLTPRTVGIFQIVGKVGHVLRGLAYGLVGVFVIQTARAAEPDLRTGLDRALAEVVDGPAGVPILAGIAVGFLAYGLFYTALIAVGDPATPE